MLQVILPMAGKASRFEGSQYQEYKPFIKIAKKRIFQWALGSLKDVAYVLYPIVQEKDYRAEVLGAYNCTLLKEYTRGALETAYQVHESLNPEMPCLVLDSDICFESKSYLELLSRPDSSIDAALVTFQSDHPRYSYVRPNAQGFAVEVKEKVVISQNAIIGAYYFSKAQTLLHYAEKTLDQNLSDLGAKEFYLSVVYQKMLEDNKIIKVYNSDQFYSLGTPEEIEASLPYLLK